MFSTSTLALLLLATIASLVSGSATPTSPDSSTVAAIGTMLKTEWAVDGTGTWNDMTIQLMTGDNFAMVPLKTLTTGIDATTQTSYSFEVPAVTPTSAIYFLQFRPTNSQTDLQWTTRFTISGADGSISTPTNATQPGGAAIPWGTGALLAGSTTNSTTSPSGGVASIQTVPASSSVVLTSTAVVAASSTTSQVSTVTTTANVVVAPSMSGMATSSSSASSARASGASAAAAGASSAAASAPASGAGRSAVIGGGSLVAGLVGLVALFA